MQIKLIIESQLEDVLLVSKATRAICNTVTQDELTLFNLELCVYEAIVNIIKHAYLNQPKKWIEITVFLHKNEIILEIIDTGLKGSIHPSPLSIDTSDIPNLPVSGYGLFLMYSLMTEIQFHHVDNKNILTMKMSLK